ncbi:MAG: glycolate oxidase subunit GlcD [Candidatus Methanolliviera sp. GoM_oil]|nr:MAG: glycolate oxidase subunit GlcD [Candidatus Methanolliviera sp. GoM_oil]
MRCTNGEVISATSLRNLVMTYGSVTEKEINIFKSIVGAEKVSTGESVLELHSKDESFHERSRPEVVVFPKSSGEISKILVVANEKRIPVTPWGAGTSLEGNPMPSRGGIVLDLQEMNRILEEREGDFQVVVEPGVVYKELNRRFAKKGLFFPPDPGAPATIGGMVANNASGIQTLKYGATKDYVLRLEVVLPSGEIFRTGSNAVKTSSGYDLCRLFTGSEGTLGVITQITLRLAPLPSHFTAVLVNFNSLEDATHAIYEIMCTGIVPAALEFLDGNVIEAINLFKNTELEEKPTLFMEFHGSNEAGLKEELSLVEEICTSHDSSLYEAGIGREERDRLWQARYDTFESMKNANKGMEIIIIDTAVPLSKYPEMVAFARNEALSKGVKGYVFGHAGSGNLHMGLVKDPNDKKQAETGMIVNDAIVGCAIDLGGTATGEHGVGIGKRKFMAHEHGQSLEVMKRIKRLFDPNGIMNPEKIFL